MRKYSESRPHVPFGVWAAWTMDDDHARKRSPRTSLDRMAQLAESNEHQPEAKRVLVVDDEHLIADTLARILNLSGFVAHAVYSGEAALAAVSTLCPDIVLTDVRMPGRNGIETGILIRSQSPQTRVVLFSGQANVIDLMDAARNDGHGFELWPKPIHPKELLKRLRAL